MPEGADPFAQLQILQELREELIAAAHRREANGPVAPIGGAWSSRRLKALVMAVVLMLAGGAIALAATGVLSGSPVRQQGPATPNAGIGVPAPGGSRLLSLRAADPQGGLPWGMRLVRTTRGEICVQIGRLDDGQLGQLGIDGAFHDDGRFHPLAPDVLPETSNSGDVSCNLAAPIRIGLWPAGDRSAAPNGPEETKFKPTAKDLRSISWGLLGPHALSITHRTAGGIQTSPVAPGTGAYLIVEAVSHLPRSIGGGAEFIGSTSGRAVDAFPPGGMAGAVIAATFRFGSSTCSVGHGAPLAISCPTDHPTHEGLAPTLRLNRPVHVKLEIQPHDSCSAAYLIYPCYRAEIEFKAPYAVTNAGSEYLILAKSSCSHARASSWSFTQNIQRGQTVRTRSSGLFNCTSDQFEVQYLRRLDNSHPTAIVGTATLRAP